MNMVDDTLKQLGNYFGIDELNFDNKGNALLRLESNLEFGFEQKKDFVIVFGSIPLSYNLPQQTLTALKGAHADKIQDNLITLNLPFQIFVRSIEQNDSLAIAFHLNKTEFTVNRTIQTIEVIQKYLANTA